MTFFTNHTKFGGDFKDPLSVQLGSCNSGVIATGYISNTTVKKYEPSILKIIENGGSFDLIVGMAFHEGLKEIQYKTLNSLHEKIRSINPTGGGVKLVYVRKYHGKIYNLTSANKNDIYLGSSNFSETGLWGNLEGTIEVKNKETKDDVLEFLDWLRDDDQSVYIDKAKDFKITDSQSFREGGVVNPKIESHEAGTYDIATIDTSKLPYLDIPLSRNLEARTRSSFNAYFGKGRLKRTTVKVTPRNWFEGEIIVDAGTIRNELYPKGFFKVITDDGYTFECKTQGDNFKDLRSTGKLYILGKWIKLKLQVNGALKPLTLVTYETFEKFGQENLRLYKMEENVYFMEFKAKL